MHAIRVMYRTTICADDIDSVQTCRSRRCLCTSVQEYSGEAEAIYQ